MNKQEFIDAWSDRVGWGLEILDRLLALLTILLVVLFGAFVLLNAGGWVVIVVPLAIAVLLVAIRFLFAPISWIFSYTIGMFLTVLAGIILGLVSLILYGRDKE